MDQVDSRRDDLAERLWARWSQVLTGRVLDFKTTPTHLRAPVYEMADEVLKWHKEQFSSDDALTRATKLVDAMLATSWGPLAAHSRVQWINAIANEIGQAGHDFEGLARALGSAHDLAEKLVSVPSGPFNYESIGDESVKTGPTPGVHYRIHDAKDNRIATCYDQDNARFIVGQLNQQ